MQQGRVPAYGSGGVRLHAETETVGQPDAAQHAARVVLKHAVAGGSQHSAHQVGFAVQRVHDGVKPLLGVPAAQGHRHGVHGEIAGAQVLLQRAVAAADINEERRRALHGGHQRNTRDVPGLHRHGSSAQEIGNRAPGGLRVPGHHQVNVVDFAPADGVADGAADNPNIVHASGSEEPAQPGEQAVGVHISRRRWRLRSAGKPAGRWWGRTGEPAARDSCGGRRFPVPQRPARRWGCTRRRPLR